jgi:hypothetical protein
MGTINAPTRYRTQDRHRKSSRQVPTGSGRVICRRDDWASRSSEVAWQVYACGVIVKRAAIRAEGEALRRCGICRCGHYVGELRENYEYCRIRSLWATHSFVVPPGSSRRKNGHKCLEFRLALKKDPPKQEQSIFDSARLPMSMPTREPPCLVAENV